MSRFGDGPGSKRAPFVAWRSVGWLDLYIFEGRSSGAVVQQWTEGCVRQKIAILGLNLGQQRLVFFVVHFRPACLRTVSNYDIVFWRPFSCSTINSDLFQLSFLFKLEHSTNQSLSKWLMEKTNSCRRLSSPSRYVVFGGIEIRAILYSQLIDCTHLLFVSWVKRLPRQQISLCVQ